MIQLKGKVKPLAVQFLFGLLLLWLWSRYVDLSKVIPYLQEINYVYVPLTAGLLFLTLFFRGWRMKIILSPIKKIRLTEAALIYNAGSFINYIIPVRAGELAKSLILKSKYDAPVSKTLPAVFIDKVIDLAVVILITIIVGPLVGFKHSELSLKLFYLAIMVLAVISAVFVLLLFKQSFFLSKSKKLVSRVIPKYEKRIHGIMENAASGLLVLKDNPAGIVSILALTMASVTTDVLTNMSYFHMINYGISPLRLVFGYALIGFIFIIPAAPGYIGSIEAAWLLVFSMGFGMDKEKIAAITLLGHIITATVIFILGAISLKKLKLKVFQQKELNAV